MPKLVPIGGFDFIKASNNARAFFDATGIVDASQRLAIEQLIYNLANHNLWDKMIAIYPMVGGTALSHSFNLRDIATFNLTFFGGWIHSETGAKPNGVNAYANTNLPHNTPSINYNGSLLNRHCSYYSRTASGASGVVLGLNDGAGTINYLYPNPLTSAISGNAVFAGSTNTRRFLAITMENKTTGNYYTDGVYLPMAPFGTIGTTIDPYFLGASNQLSGTAAFFSNCECAFASVGLGLSFDDLKKLEEIVNLFQEALNRQV